jgi:putative MATE family efflux protein
MRDLTQGPIVRHILGMAAFIGVGLIVQTLYVLVDLYFVSHLGERAIAGVAAAGSTNFIGIAASQLIAVGSLALISQAVGRKDDADAQLIFEQALSLSLFAVLAIFALGYLFGGAGVTELSADAPTAAMARTYLFTFLPALAVMFPSAALASALRASGVVAPAMVIQVLSLLLNVILAPILIAGWGTGVPLGVAGAGLASSLAALIGIVALAAIFNRVQGHLRLHAALAPRWAVWRRIAAVGLPSAAEFMLMFVVMGVIYWAIRGFGAEAQAGFGIGSRVMQSVFLPAMAVAFAAAPIVGQNFGAGQAARVRAAFRATALIGSAIMVLLTVLCHVVPGALIAPFTSDPGVAAIAVDYLSIISLNFVATGLIFACSGVFQGLGDTRPSLISSASRLVTFVLPIIWLSGRPGATLHDFWYVSVTSVALQAVISLLLLRNEFRRKLSGLVAVET